MPIEVKPIDFHWKVHCYCEPLQGSNWSGWYMLGSSLINASTHDKKLTNPKMKVCAIFLSFKCENWYDPGDLGNEVKVKFLHAKKGLVILHLGYKYQICTLDGYWLMSICLSHWLLWVIWILTHKIQKRGNSDLKGVVFLLVERHKSPKSLAMSGSLTPDWKGSHGCTQQEAGRSKKG